MFKMIKGLNGKREYNFKWSAADYHKPDYCIEKNKNISRRFTLIKTDF